MSEKGLTDKQIKFMKPGEKRVEVPVGSPSGLFLVLHTSGKKSWMFRYRYRGRTRGLTFPKQYPAMTLAAARAEAEAAIDKLKEDKDPAVTQAEEIKQETPESVKAVADEWIKRHVKQKTSERSQDEYE